MKATLPLRFGPIARLSLGLMALLLSLLVTAEMLLGVVPGRGDTDRVVRRRVAENLAVQITPLLEAGDTHTLGKTIQHVLARDPEIRSITVRRSDGSTLLQRGRTPSSEQAAVPAASTVDLLRVPVHSRRETWGDIDIRFTSAEPTEAGTWLAQPEVQLLLLFGIGGSLLCYGYLRRAMHFLNPSASVPDRVRKGFDVLGEGLLIVDQQGRVVLANRAFRSLHPSAEGELNGRPIEALDWLARQGGTSAAASWPWVQALNSGQAVSAQPFALHQPDGGSKKLLVSSAPITDNKGRARGCMVTFDDVTAVHLANDELRRTLGELQKSRERIEEQNSTLRHLASRDSLTGCLNRRAFFELAAELLARAHRGQADLCCLMVDIDHFKGVNDTYGHAVGDQVIQAVARRLNASIRETDLLARFGGEEFCILLPKASLADASVFAERVRADIESTVCSEIRGSEVTPVTASFGLAAWNVTSRSIEALIEQADHALYQSKQHGRNRVTSWDRAAKSAPEPGMPDEPLVQSGTVQVPTPA